MRGGWQRVRTDESGLRADTPWPPGEQSRWVWLRCGIWLGTDDLVPALLAAYQPQPKIRGLHRRFWYEEQYCSSIAAVLSPCEGPCTALAQHTASVCNTALPRPSTRSSDGRSMLRWCSHVRRGPSTSADHFCPQPNPSTPPPPLPLPLAVCKSRCCTPASRAPYTIPVLCACSAALCN